jgi:hypothetical protein
MLSGLVELISAMLEGLIPPHTADIKVQYRYRVRLTLVACGGFLGVIFLWIASFGFAPSVFPGFARSDRLEESIKESRRHWVFDAETALLELREKQCKASGSDLRQLLQDTILRRQREYFDLTGVPFSMPSCSDL